MIRDVLAQFLLSIYAPDQILYEKGKAVCHPKNPCIDMQSTNSAIDNINKALDAMELMLEREFVHSAYHDALSGEDR